MAIGSRLWAMALGVAALLVAPAADAHPHVWVTSKSELVFAADGTVSAVRHAWTFDEMFSAFATQGLARDEEGRLTREVLAELAEVNVTSLKEFGYFSVGKSRGKDVVFAEPVDYWLEADENNVLTLHFTLPVESNAPKGRFILEVYDPTWFVDFRYADESPVVLANAPAGCSADVEKPEPQVAMMNLSESFFNSLTAASDFGSQFANRITVRCN